MTRGVWWTTGSGRIELRIRKEDAHTCSHPGPADADVKALSARPYIAKQLATLDPELLVSELREWGAWEPEDLTDHDVNLQRILWLAACDVSEGNV
jgi:hypothetical protein